MTQNDQQDTLGSPVPPFTAHAISVSLPTWRDNMDYEEGAKQISDVMVSGYPRFFLHLSIQKLSPASWVEWVAHDVTILCLAQTLLVVRLVYSYGEAHHEDAEACQELAPAQVKATGCPSAGLSAALLLDVRVIVHRAVSFVRGILYRIDFPVAQTSIKIISIMTDHVVNMLTVISSSLRGYVNRNSACKMNDVSSRLCPMRKIAERCRAFMIDRSTKAGSPVPVRLVQFTICPEQDDTSTSCVELHIVLFPKDVFPLAKQFWQHTDTGSPGSPKTPAPAPGRPPVKPGNRHYSAKSLGKSPPASPSVLQARFGPSITESSAEPLSKAYFNYVEERYGRNLPLKSAAAAKRAMRRRIAGVLIRDTLKDCAASSKRCVRLRRSCRNPWRRSSSRSKGPLRSRLLVPRPGPGEIEHIASK
ncbi:hypothetical protein C8T65DRAFT_702524 [Cerioporus squamosus]|nr:hypothetical protein C8T65DRAFT_702524 [Cerioporus squamosus]